MDASYELIDERPALRLERRIAHPVGAVWAALTEKEELAGWFPSTIEGELRAGSRLTFSFPGKDSSVSRAIESSQVRVFVTNMAPSMGKPACSP